MKLSFYRVHHSQNRSGGYGSTQNSVIAGIAVLPDSVKQLTGKACNGMIYKIKSHKGHTIKMGGFMAEQKTKRVTFHLPISTVAKIEKLAARENQDVSKIIRKAIDAHLSIQANKDDIDFISGIIRQEVKAEIGKQANRLAAMLFKVGIIASSNYFMDVKMLADVISPSMQEDFKDINSNARKLGIEYMKQNGVNAVGFLEDDEAVLAATEKLKTDFSEE